MSSVTSIVPLYIAPVSFFIGMILLSYIVVGMKRGRRPLKTIYFWGAVVIISICTGSLWHFYFSPTIDEQEREKYRQIIATNTNQRADLDRKQALEILTKKGTPIQNLDLDGADINGIALSFGGNLHSLSMVAADASRGIFTGVNFEGSILSETDFSS